METITFLLSINTRWWNAEAHYAYNLGLALELEGHQVVFLVNMGSPVAHKAVDHGFLVVEDIPLDDAKPWVQWSNLGKLKSKVHSLQVNCIVSFKSSGSWIFAALHRSLPALTHIRVRGEARAPKQNGFNRWLYGVNGCDGILCSGEQVQRWVKEIGGQLPPVQVLHFGAPELEDSELKNPVELPAGLPVLCLLGRSQPVKGHLICLDAFAALGRTDVTLLFLVKRLEEFPEHVALIREKIIELGLENQVILAGPMPNLKAVLSQVQIGLIPSLGSEVNCRVLVEFFAQGIPVVASAVGTLPDLIHRGENGWICEELSAESLKIGMEEGLKHHLTWGAQARQDYQELYRLEPFARQFLGFFASVRRH